MERLKFLTDLFSRGLDSDSIIATHGTSLEVIQQAVKTGNIPGSTIKKSRRSFYHPPGCLYINLTPDAAQSLGLPKDQANSGGYGEDIAKRHYLLSKLGLDFSNSRYSSLATDLTGPFPDRTIDEALKQLKEMAPNLEKDQLEQLIREAESRKGVLLGLDKSIADQYQIQKAEGDDDGWYIEIPNGMPINFLAGLEPQGQQEWDYFENLQKALNI
ncbi:MAG: hypothetical protein A3H14_02260 [Candidatus Doudnabacteria bacterium RIFCSPLOWO2_12_FULL_49_8]|nr:MAG: hypothetical protein A3H14_02260 [Candidatus Doudnabacteria bacterium RIFCSPLOWO2_12_FULL_49_8]